MNEYVLASQARCCIVIANEERLERMTQGLPYLVVGPDNPHWGAVIQAKSNRPNPAVAKRLLTEGALVASGILLGHAQAFAARVHRYWPHLAAELTETLSSGSPDMERRLSVDGYRHISRSVINSIRLCPPTFPMRAFRV